MKIFNEFSWNAVDNILSIVFKFILIAYVTKKLGFEQYGLISYGAALVTISLGFVHLGLPGLAVREFVQNQTSTSRMASSIFFLRLIVSSFFYLCVCLFLLAGEFSVHDTLYLLTITVICLFSPLEYSVFYLQSQLASRNFLSIKMSFMVIDFAIKMIVVNQGYPLFFYALSTVLATAAPLVITCARLKGIRLQLSQVSKAYSKTLLRSCGLIYLGAIANSMLLRIDQVMLDSMAGRAELGAYAVSVNFVEMLYFFAPIMMGALYPMLIKVWGGKSGQRYKVVHGLATILLLFSLAISIALALSSFILVPIVWDVGAESILGPLQVLLLGVPIVFLRALLSKLIIIDEKYSLSVMINFTALILNIAINYFLIPEYGGIGAAISTVLSLVLANLACFLLIPLMCEYRKIFMQGLSARNSHKANFGILYRVVLGER